MRRHLLAAAVTLLIASPATAQRYEYGGSSSSAQLVLNGGAFVLNSTDQGWISTSSFYNTGSGGPSNTNYFTGTIDGSAWFRDWFSFSTADLPTITSAALRLNTYSSYGGPNTVDFYDYVGAESDLFNFTNLSGTYADVGSGTFYGTRTYTSADDYTVQDVTLNAAAIADINSTTDGYYTLGGRFADESSNQVTPEPTTMVLLGSGLAGIAARRRRKAAVPTA